MRSDRVHLSTTNASQVEKIHCCSKKWALLLFAVASFTSRAWPSGGRQPAPQPCEQPRSFRALHAQGTQTAATGIASSLHSRRSSQLPCWTDWSASQSERRKWKYRFWHFLHSQSSAGRFLEWEIQVPREVRYLDICFPSGSEQGSEYASETENL